MDLILEICDNYLRSATSFSMSLNIAKSLFVLKAMVAYEIEIATVAVIIYNESMYSFGLSATRTAKIHTDIMFKLHIKWAPKCRLLNG